MPLPHPAGASDRFHRICLAAAFLITLAWGVLYISWGNPGIVDEPYHLSFIDHFAHRRPGVPEGLPYIPGYHLGVVLLAPGHPTLFSARLVTLGFALVGLVAFAGAWRRLHGTHPGGATFLFATLPILQPFTAMAYTDAPAIALVLTACWAQFDRRHALAAGLFALASLIRQTALIWAAYLLMLELLNEFRPRGTVPWPRWRDASWTWLENGRWLLLLLATGAGIILYTGRLTVGSTHGIRASPNLANIHFAGLLLLLLGLPYWVTNGAAMLQRLREAAATRPRLVAGWTASSLGVAAVLAITYSNPNPWNQGLFWPGPPSNYTLIRNWPLVWIDRLAPLRILSGLAVVSAIAGLAFLFTRQRFARELWLLLPFGALLLLSNQLVEPRYLIPPCTLALLWLEPGAELPRQAAWFGLICLLQAPFVLTGLALW